MTERIAQVYLIRLDGTKYFKIGMTTDLTNRIATIQTATPFVVTLIISAAHKNAYAVEHDMHEMLKMYRVRNEWFQCELTEIMRVFETISAMAIIDQALDDRDLEIESMEAARFSPIAPIARTHVNDQIETMLRQGHSYRQIERQLSVSHATIAQINRALRSAVLKSPIFNDELEDGM